MAFNLFNLFSKSKQKNTRSYSNIRPKSYMNFVAQNTSAELDIRRDLANLRATSRALFRDDDYCKRFKTLLRVNVVGNNGLSLQNKSGIKEYDDFVEASFKKWAKKGNCDVTGRHSFIDICNLIITTLAEDGEVIVRKVRGFDNEHSFALQLLEADHLDINFNDFSRNISMGIEYDKYSKPIAYHLFTTHPGALINQDRTRIRVPADEIIHVFLPLRISATRGIPWLHTAITSLKMLNGYYEAELVAARTGAMKAGFFTQKGGDKFTGDTNTDDLPSSIEPGEITALPSDVDFVPYDPQHPSTAFPDFTKTFLLSIASAMDVSYASLTNDLKGTSFGSMRSGTLSERDVYRMLQKFLIEHFCDEFYTDFLEMAVLSGNIKIPFSMLDEVNKPYWMTRGFAWLDPYKDTLSNVIGIQQGFKTLTDVLSENGKDIEEHFIQLKKEKELKEQYGIQTLSDVEILGKLQETLQKEEAMEDET